MTTNPLDNRQQGRGLYGGDEVAVLKFSPQFFSTQILSPQFKLTETRTGEYLHDIHLSELSQAEAGSRFLWSPRAEQICPEELHYAESRILSS